MALGSNDILAKNFKVFYDKIRPYLNSAQAEPFVGATASESGGCGLVPEPQAGDNEKVLKGDGSWGKAFNYPVGMICAFMAVTAPDGFLACDGSTKNIADYQALADFIKAQFGSYTKFGGDGTTTFGLPNLSGEFLRGAGTNGHANQGAGAAVGTHQDATVIPNFYIDSTNKMLSVPGSNIQITNPDTAAANASGNGFSSYGTPSGSYPQSASVRPTNTAVLYCISY